MSFGKKILFIVVLYLPVFLAAVAVNAQPGNPGDDPDKVPITGMEYLLVSGALLGGYKLLKKTPRKSS